MPEFSLEPWKSIQIEDAWYRAVQFLGKGGSATTYLTMCSSPPSRKGTLWAIKFYTNFSKPERIPGFLASFDFLKSCEHPSIMRVVNAGEWYHYPAIVAEYLPQTLRGAIQSQEASMVEKVSYAMQLLSALVHLNQMHVVHRDIKPQNIFLGGKTCVLGDFGMMKHVSLDDAEDRQILKDSTGPGMPVFYRTPDLVSYYRGESSITPASDVYQLGIVLAELFTGRNPMKLPSRDSSGAIDYGSEIVREDISWVKGDLGSRIKDLIEQMLELDPATRPSAERLVDWWEDAFRAVVDMSMSIDERPFK